MNMNVAPAPGWASVQGFRKRCAADLNDGEFFAETEAAHSYAHFDSRLTFSMDPIFILSRHPERVLRGATR
jgi:hypothetical protein